MNALPINVTELKARYRRELRDFDNRPAKYKPRSVITPIGAALLLHRAIDEMNRHAEPDADESAEGGDA